MREQIKLYLCNEEGQRFFGEGPYQLLRCIERCGSLRSAAQEMNMAYTKAFHLIRHAEEELGFPLTEKTIGGTGGGMAGVVDAALARSPSARICISAIALETLSAAAAALTAHGLAAQVTQVAVSRTRPAGGLHLLMANNPVFLVTGNCE